MSGGRTPRPLTVSSALDIMARIARGRNVPETEPFYYVVLTGGMACGKSTVAKAFHKQHFYHWDADATVHSLYRHGADNGLREAVRAICPEAIPDDDSDADWPISMPVLRRAIQSDPSLVGRLERIVGPRLVADLGQFLDFKSNFDTHRSASFLVDTPLYFEDRASDIRETVERAAAKRGGNLATIVVSCSPAVQLERAMARPGMTQEKFNILTARQLPHAKKRDLADYVIDTSGSLEDTKFAVENIMVALRLGGFF